MKRPPAFPPILFLLLAGSLVATAQDQEPIAHALPETPLTLKLPPAWQSVPPALLPLVQKMVTARTREGIGTKFKPVALFTKGPFGQVNPIYGPALWVVVCRDMASIDDGIQRVPDIIASSIGSLNKVRDLSRIEPAVVGWEAFNAVVVMSKATTVDGKKVTYVGWGFFVKGTSVAFILASGSEAPDAEVTAMRASLAKLDMPADKLITAEEIAKAKASVSKMQIPFSEANYNMLRQDASDARNVKHDVPTAISLYDAAAKVCEQAQANLGPASAAGWSARWAEMLNDKADMLVQATRAAEALSIVDVVRQKCAAYEKLACSDDKWRSVFVPLAETEIKAARQIKDAGRAHSIGERWKEIVKQAAKERDLNAETRRRFARPLFMIADSLKEAKQLPEALAAVEAALDFMTPALNDESNDSFVTEFISGLNRHSSILADTSHRAEAIAAARHAVMLSEKLVARAGDRFKITLASANASLGDRLASKSTDPDAAEALGFVRRAIQIADELKPKNLLSESNMKAVAGWQRKAATLAKKEK